MQKLRKLHRVFATILLTIAVGYGALYVYGMLQLRRANSRVKALQSVQIGEPLPPSLAYMVSNPESDETIVSALPFMPFWGRRSIQMPKIMPWEWWFVIASFEIDSDGKVVTKYLWIADQKHFQFPLAMLSVENKDFRSFDPCTRPAQLRHPGYSVSHDMRTGFLEVQISSHPNPDLIRSALDVRLQCLSSRRGCDPPEELLPQAASALAEDAKFAKEDARVPANGGCTIPKDYCCFHATEPKQTTK